MAQIICKNVSLGYEGRVVTKGLDFEVNAGDYLCIVGENGSGKSTLIKALLGLLPHVSGSIQMGEGLKNTEIGYLPQQTVVQRDFPASVWEIVLSGCLNQCGLRPFYNKKEKEKAKAALVELAIEELEKKCYRELSGGQQQRVLLARALCATKKALFLDEPAAGLDPKAEADMYSLIHRLNEQEKTTIIMVSHDMESALKYATRILHVGKIPLFYDNKDDYRNSQIGAGRQTKDEGVAEND